MASSMASAVGTRLGRHLLDHCFSATGGAHDDDHVNATETLVAGAGADSWAGPTPPPPPPRPSMPQARDPAAASLHPPPSSVLPAPSSILPPPSPLHTRRRLFADLPLLAVGPLDSCGLGTALRLLVTGCPASQDTGVMSRRVSMSLQAIPPLRHPPTGMRCQLIPHALHRPSLAHDRQHNVPVLQSCQALLLGQRQRRQAARGSTFRAPHLLAGSSTCSRSCLSIFEG